MTEILRKKGNYCKFRRQERRLGSRLCHISVATHRVLRCSPTDCLANGTNANISSNHSHSLTVSMTDVQNAVDKTYAIQGSATHNHDVTISAANFTSLKNNTSIQVSSTSGDGHSHNITVSCA